MLYVSLYLILLMALFITYQNISFNYTHFTSVNNYFMYLLVAFCFFKFKTTHKYKYMLKEINHLYNILLNTELNIIICYAGYEITAHKAVIKCFLTCRKMYCF